MWVVSQTVDMHTYIAPIGYDSARVTRPVLSHGVTPDDKIILLQPKNENEDGRASEAVSDVKRLVTELEPSLSLELVDLEHDNFPDSIVICSELIEGAEGEVVVVLGGGARDIFFSLSVAAIAHQKLVDTVLQFSDIDGQIREIPLPNFAHQLTQSQIETLHSIAISDTPLSLSDLAEITGISKSTAARHVQKLETNGFVESEYHGRAKIIDLTEMGVIHHSIYKTPSS